MRMAPSKDECIIRDVKLRSGQLGPVLVTFEHGQLKKDVASELNCGVYTPDDSSKLCTIGTVAQDGDVVYQGDVHRDKDNICRTFLAIRNKKNNKMRIYEANHAMLSPSIGSSFIDHVDVQDAKAANYNLSHAFGSKKSKRIADQKARMEVNVDSVKDKLSTTVRDIKVTEDDLASVDDDSLTKLLPPCFREAKAPADIYPINGLLKNKELTSLESFYKTAFESEEFDTSDMSSFFKHMANNIASGNFRSMALLLYAESLVKFCNLHPKQISKKGAIYCPFSESVHKRILKTFTTVHSKNISRSQFLTDKAVMYIIILSLHINAYQLDLDIIAKAITHMNISRIKMLARSIGTVPSKNSGAPKTIVVLKAPLPPPQSLIMKARKSSQR